MCFQKIPNILTSASMPTMVRHDDTYMRAISLSLVPSLVHSHTTVPHTGKSRSLEVLRGHDGKPEGDEGDFSPHALRHPAQHSHTHTHMTLAQAKI